MWGRKHELCGHTGCVQNPALTFTSGVISVNYSTSLRIDFVIHEIGGPED